MKREIKFRGCDPDTKRWYFGLLVKQNKTTYVTSEDYDQNPSNTEWFILWDEMTDWCLPNRHIQGSVDPESIGEYTGLKDKNGREIYEGDIVRSIPRRQREKSFVGDVRYGRVDPSFTIHDKDGHDFRLYLRGGYRTYEVIGNIYENPELLD